MQKISSYLYPNRIELLADLAGFTTEYVNVYQRTVKLYKGVDNVMEFDIKNADQKRVDLTTLDADSIKMNVMDAVGKGIGQYDVIPTAIKGIATVTIPGADLADLKDQYLSYSVLATKDAGATSVILYGDTRFGAMGKIELAGTVLPVTRGPRTYDTFTAEIDLAGHPTYHSSGIPATFYEAVKTETLDFDVDLSGFVGSVWLEATKQSTLNTEAWKAAPYLISQTFFADNPGNGTHALLHNTNIGDYKYFRVSYTTPISNGVGASFRVELADNTYTVTVRSGGTGYAVSSQIKVLGSTIGGVDGINDLIITVADVDGVSTGYPSSYAVSSVQRVVWTGTAPVGTGTFLVTGTNITGTVDKITVS